MFGVPGHFSGCLFVRPVRVVRLVCCEPRVLVPDLDQSRVDQVEVSADKSPLLGALLIARVRCIELIAPSRCETDPDFGMKVGLGGRLPPIGLDEPGERVER